VVYFVAKNGEIVADALEFEVAGTLTNFVEIYTSRSSLNSFCLLMKW
jgi:hypothetical protein